MAIETIEEIKKFVREGKVGYEKVLRSIKRILEDYYDSPAGRRALYRVATRGDYQQGNEFKTPQSIQQKIRDRQKEKPGYSKFHIEDIIGARIICIYPSDVEIVKSYIRNLDNKSLKIEDEELKETDSGYRAYHFIVTLPRPTLAQYKCEIQIVTMLQETWSFKTHGLTYKGKEVVKKEHKERTKLLSDALDVMDKQSQLLERQIRRKREEEQKRKNAAKVSFMKELAKVKSLKNINAEQRKELQELKDYILKNEGELRYGDVNEVVDRIHKYRDQFKKVDRGICRIIALLAVIRDTDDLDGVALEYADRLICALTSKNKCKAYMLKSVMFWSFNRLENAINEAKGALSFAKRITDKSLINPAKINIAYFIADLGDKNREDQARKYINELRKAVLSKEDEENFLDADGYTKIVFGQTVEEVSEGLTLCERAFNQSETKDVAEPFFKIHEHKALQRLLELSEKDFPPLAKECLTK